MLTYGEKEVVVEPGPQGHSYAIRFVTGGEIPQAFQGLFTSRAEATKVVHMAVPPVKKPAKQPAKQMEDES
jgi:hypothetical protein